MKNEKKPVYCTIITSPISPYRQADNVQNFIQFSIDIDYQDHNRDDQGYVDGQQVVLSAYLKSATEKSQIWIGSATAAWRGYLFCRTAAVCGLQKLKVPHEAQLARLAPHLERGLLLLGEGHKV